MTPPTPMVDVGTSTAAITAPSREELATEQRRSASSRPIRKASLDSASADIERPPAISSESASAPVNHVHSGMTEEQVALAIPDSGDQATSAQDQDQDQDQAEDLDEPSAEPSPRQAKPAPHYAAVPPVAPLRPAAPKAPERRYAGLPPVSPDFVTPPAVPQAPGLMPSSEIELRHELKRLGVTYEDIPPIHPGGACGIDYPVKVMALSGGIQMRPPAVLNARMALTFAKYIKNDFAPAVRWRYYSGITAIRDGSYSCRRMIGESTHHLSEHAKGNAIDLMGVTLDSGRVIDVEKPGWFSFRERGFLNKVRGEACSYFTTVLGPGYNWAHHNHFHFDLMQRRNGYVACR